MTFWTVSR